MLGITMLAGPGRCGTSWQDAPSTNAVGTGEQQKQCFRDRRFVLGNHPTPAPQRATAPRRWT